MICFLLVSTNIDQSEDIWLPDRQGDNSRPETTAQKEKFSMDSESPSVNPLEEAATTSTNDGRRLYVGNLPYAATVEDLMEFFKGFSV